MDGGAIPRPAPAPSAAPPVRSDSAPARPSAPIQSAPEKVVQPVGEEPAVRLDIAANRRRIADLMTAVDRQQDFDKEAKAVVVAWVDKDTGDVVDQYPSEQALKLKAYWRDKLAESQSSPSGQGPVVA